MLCDNIPGLAGRQRRLCRMHPGVMVSLGEGAKMGIKECQSQFRFHRWNCSTLDRDASVFGKVMLKGRVNERMQQSDKHWRHFKVRNIFISYMITCDNYPVIILDYTLQLWICEFKLYQYNALINPFIYKLYIFITKSIYVHVSEKVFDPRYYEYYTFRSSAYKENRTYSPCEINVSFKAIAVNHISHNLVESEISGVRTTVSAFIFYDIRKR